ncbi:hypothetical protein [uncultured Treponema sp.]|uniref:hypothetical protein n=1 Tax=uncultured Treponema sp. TaxID=162155 RepID=UPI0015C0CFC9|nr:hypothetical protein [uncultured Treponema sp.]
MKTWPQNVSKKAYELSVTFGKNYTEVSFEAGTKRRILNDLKVRKKYSFKIDMQDDPVNQNTEYKKFMNWFETEIHGGAESFSFIDFENTAYEKEYFFSDSPSVTGQEIKTLSFSVEEA